jgi:hypothetical protein
VHREGFGGEHRCEDGELFLRLGNERVLWLCNEVLCKARGAFRRVVQCAILLYLRL